jgi:hypothetical protein
LTTNGIAAVIQLAYPLYPTPINKSPATAPYYSLSKHWGYKRIIK